MVSAEPYVIDASATVEYLLESDVGLQVAALIAGARLVAPEMLDAEVLSALRRKVQVQAISEAWALEALARLEDLPIERVSHRTLTRAAWELRHNVSAYDALYVAIAQERGATLLTFDGPLTRAPASVLDVAVRNVGVS
jgi:predicted nucleic acid-binding protein